MFLVGALLVVLLLLALVLVLDSSVAVQFVSALFVALVGSALSLVVAVVLMSGFCLSLRT